jgi:hypothetical protein
MAKFTITCRDFKAHRRNTLVGFATVRVAELHLDISDIAVHERNGGYWAQLPARPMLDKNGVAIRDPASGKVSYANVFQFTDKATRDAFSHAVINAVLRVFPEAFANSVKAG